MYCGTGNVESVPFLRKKCSVRVLYIRGITVCVCMHVRRAGPAQLLLIMPVYVPKLSAREDYLLNLNHASYSAIGHLEIR